MAEKAGKTPEGVSYKYFQCSKCGEEIVDMKQLHSVANRYRTMKQFRVKVTKWGSSLGIRIPKELTLQYNFGDEISLVPEKNGIRIVP